MHTEGMDKALNIKTLRKELGWTQEQLAVELGLDRSSVSRMENGQPVKGPTEKLLRSLARKPKASDMAEAS